LHFIVSFVGNLWLAACCEKCGRGEGLPRNGTFQNIYFFVTQKVALLENINFTYYIPVSFERKAYADLCLPKISMAETQNPVSRRGFVQ
jgi:hypothetical protein